MAHHTVLILSLLAGIILGACGGLIALGYQERKENEKLKHDGTRTYPQGTITTEDVRRAVKILKENPAPVYTCIKCHEDYYFFGFDGNPKEPEDGDDPFCEKCDGELVLAKR